MKRSHISFRGLIIGWSVLYLLSFYLRSEWLTGLLGAIIVFIVGIWLGTKIEQNGKPERPIVEYHHSTDGFASDVYDNCQAQEILPQGTTEVSIPLSSPQDDPQIHFYFLAS